MLSSPYDKFHPWRNCGKLEFWCMKIWNFHAWKYKISGNFHAWIWNFHATIFSCVKHFVRERSRYECVTCMMMLRYFRCYQNWEYQDLPHFLDFFIRIFRFFFLFYVFYCRFSVMENCCRENPAHRPSFTKLVLTFDNMLQRAVVCRKMWRKLRNSNNI